MTDDSVVYSDEERYFCVNREKGWKYHDIFMEKEVLDKLFPITMPYTVSEDRYKMVCSEFCWDRRPRQDFRRIDTYALWEIYTPDEEKVVINRFWKMTNNGMVEIDIDEWNHRTNTVLTADGEVPADTVHDEETVPVTEF